MAEESFHQIIESEKNAKDTRDKKLMERTQPQSKLESNGYNGESRGS